ncbi:CDP-alcohol phosphatidyltransferase family protein [Flavobacteriales bacterium]|nr:CDP-alcohol phosphatidyltransferase family protein [Flavobacteriales bacterium]
MERREARGIAWRALPANVLTLTNLGVGALVCWWAASEFDLGWSPAEWLASLGLLEAWMGITGAEERRIAGLQWMLLVWMFGQLCDLLDGAVARWMGAQNGQGAMLDSMADLVSAGLAPAFVGIALMMEWHAMGILPKNLGWLSVLPLTVVMAAAWRLARYSLQAVTPKSADDSSPQGFEGIPAPFAALFWGGLLLIWSQSTGTEGRWLWLLGLGGATLLPLGMVSHWPQAGFKQWGADKKWDAMRCSWLLMVLLVCLFFRPAGVAVALISYPLLGAIRHLLLSKKSH